MASTQNQRPAPAASVHQFPSLPHLPEAVTSGAREDRSSQLRAGSWAHSVRQRINRQLKKTGKPARLDVDLLTSELINVFATTLQKNSRSSWVYLQEVFHLLRPYREHLGSREELLPYLENVYFQYQSNQALLSDLDILGAMDKAFPKDSSILYHGPQHPKYRRKGPPQLQPLPDGITVATNPEFAGQRYPFVFERGSPEDFLRPPPVSLQELQWGVGVVGAELAQGEALWSSSLGLASLALRTALPVEFQPADEDEDEGESCVIDADACQKPTPRKHHKPGPLEHQRMSGQMAVELFIKHRHLGKINFLYLNIAPNRHFRPYDLVVVSKGEVNPEHYVFSPFGVLHVHPEDGADTMTLGEWHREAILWKLMQDIPLFKLNLVRRSFTCWLKNARHLHFLKRQEALGCRLLSSVPHFGASLQHISRLLNELSTFHWLPLDPSHCYSLVELQEVLNQKRCEAKGQLCKFLILCTKILDLVRKDSYKMVEILQEQVENSKPLVAKESIYFQKVQHTTLERRLNQAESWLYRLGNLASLIDHMTGQSLVTFVQEEMTSFVHDVVQKGDLKREAFLRVSLVFDAASQLSLIPSHLLLEEVFSKTLDAVVASVVQVADSWNDSEEKVSNYQHNTETHAKLQDSTEDTPDPKQAAPGHQEVLTAILDPQLSSGYQAEIFSNILLAPVPRLVQKLDFSQIGSLSVVGHRMKRHYLAHSLGHLEQDLRSNMKIQQAVSKLRSLLAASLQDIHDFCLLHAWLTEIHVFTRSWNPGQARGMRGWSSQQYEDLIIKLQSWTKRAKGVKPSFVTSNGMLLVECRSIQEEIGPLLASITNDLLSRLTSESRERTHLLLKELGEVMKVLDTINTDIPTVSRCARKVEKYKKLIPDLQARIDCIRSLSEVIRIHFRQLTPEEEALENTMLDTWESFNRLLKEASEFISSKLPTIENKLKQSFLAVSSELEQLVTTATTGRFLDPTHNALAVVKELGDFGKKLQSLISTLQNLSRSRQTLEGKAFDLSFIAPREKQVIARQDIWKLFRKVSEQLNTWKRLLFAKFNPETAQQKMDMWQTTLASMEGSLSGEDPVFQECVQLLRDFQQYLTVLEMLASPVMKEKHWKAIYAVMGVDDPGEEQVTLADLLTLPCLRYRSAIAKIWHNAKTETSCLQTLENLKTTWQEQHFRLAKFLLNVQMRDPAPDRSRRPSSGRFRELEEGLFSKDTGTFILIDIERLKVLLEDSLITLQMLHFSPRAVDLRKEVEEWTKTLQALGLSLDLWITFQQKWIFLNRVLYEMDVPFPRSETVSKFEEVDRGYREFIQTTSEDSLVLSILAATGKSKRDWVARGEPLRAMFTNGMTVMEEIIRDLSYLLGATRANCPRLYFLSDDEVIAILSSSIEPAQRVLWARRCFQNVEDVQFEILETDSDSSAFAVYAPRAIAKAFTGCCGEKVPLRSPIKGDLKATTWLSHFEYAMKETLSLALRKCLTERSSLKQKLDVLFGSRPGSTLPDLEPPKLQKAGENWAKLAKCFPLQCVLVAEEVSWWNEVEETLFNKSAKKTSLGHKQRLKVQALVKYAQRCRREYAPRDPMDVQLLPLLSALIALSVHHRDIICNLSKLKVETKASFEWAKLLKYNMNLSIEDSEEYIRSPKFNLQNNQTENKHPECYMEVLDGKLPYDFEYVGPNSMCLGSATMEKSILGLILAIEQFQCASVISHEGVSKTETILGLANALARHIVVFNCSAQTGLHCISQQLSGALQSGAWLVLGSADYLCQGTLSMLGQLLGDVHKAFAAMLHSREPNNSPSPVAISEEWSQEQAYPFHKDCNVFWKLIEHDYGTVSSKTPYVLGNILFNGYLITAHQNYGCFMTLSQCNSSSNIPANLRMVMRPVSIVYPNLERMAEVSMLSAGFQDATRLAVKIRSFFDSAHKSGAVRYPSGYLIVRRIIESSVAFLDKSSIVCHLDSCSTPLSWTEEQRSVSSAPSNADSLTDVSEGADTNTEDSALLFDRRRSAAHLSVNLGLEEERALIRALNASSLLAVPDPAAQRTMRDLLRNVFPMSATLISESDNFSKLGKAVYSELQESKLHANSDLTATVLQLHQALLQARGVIITGPSGSGKSTSWKILAQALNRLATSDGESTKYIDEEEQDIDSAYFFNECYGPVTSEWLYPNSLTTEEFLGKWKGGKWEDGLFAKLLRTSAPISLAHLDTVKTTFKEEHFLATRVSDPHKWVVLDGSPRADWLDYICCLFGPHPFLTLPDSQKIRTPKLMKFIFEVTDLANISPSLSTQCSLVYFHGSAMWRTVLAACISSLYIRYSATQATVETVRILCEELFPPTLTFLQQMCSSVLLPHAHLAITGLGSAAHGIYEITSFQNIFHALLDQCLRRDKTTQSATKEPKAGGKSLKGSGTRSAFSGQRQRLDELIPAEHHLMMQHCFVYAYIWAFGSHLHPRHWPQFNLFVREALLCTHCQIDLPRATSVFDLCLCPVTSLLKIVDGTHLKGHIVANFTVLPQYESLFCLMSILLGSCHPVLLAGEAGSGKSSFMQMMLDHNYTYDRIPITAFLTATQLRQLWASQVSSSRKRNILLSSPDEPKSLSARGLPLGYLFLLDDLHVAVPCDGNRSTQILEMIRQALSEHTFQSAELHQLGHYCNPLGINYVGTVATAADQTCALSPRLTRLFTVVSLPAVTRASLISIYTRKIRKWLRQEPSLSRFNEIATALVSATVDLYHSAKRAIRPSPSNSHYLFSLHDIEKVLKSLFLLSPPFVVPLPTPLNGSTDTDSASNELNLGNYTFSTLNTRVVARLWLHESLRTFCDRLLTEEEKVQFTGTLTGIAESFFCTEDTTKNVSAEVNKPMEGVTLAHLQEEDGHEEVTPISERPLAQETPITTQDVEYDHGGVIASETSNLESQEQEDLSRQETEQDIGNVEHKARSYSRRTMDSYDLTSESISGRLSSTAISSTEEDESESVSEKETDLEETMSVDATSQFTVLKNRSTTSLSSWRSSVYETGSPLPRQIIAEEIGVKVAKPEGEVVGAEKKTVYHPSPPPQSTKPLSTRQPSRRHLMPRRKSKKRTMKKEHEAPQSPTAFLLPPNLLQEPGENLKDLIFSIDLLVPNSSKTDVHTYQECHLETFAKQLHVRLNKQNQEDTVGNGLVFCKAVLQHLARLIRTLITPHGHGILIAMKFCTGRRSLISLAAKLTQTKLFELPDHGEEADVNTLICEACWNAGILGKATAVLTHERVGTNTLHKLMAVMAEGTFQGLCLHGETEQILHRFLKAHKKIRKTIPPEVVLERFHQTVKKNLHVVVLMDSNGGQRMCSSLMGALLKLAYSVDVYHACGYESLMEIALKELEDAINQINWAGADINDWEVINSSLPKEPKLRNTGQTLLMEYQSLVPCVSRLLAQIHLSAATYAEHLSPQLPLITLKTFLDFIDVFLLLLTQLQQSTGAQLDRMKKAVSRMDEVNDRVEQLRKDVEDLTERRRAALEVRLFCSQLMEEERVALIQAARECEHHKTMHERLKQQLEALQTERQTTEDQILHEYSERASKLTVNNMEEIKSYRAPPPPVIAVTDVLCMMFSKEPGWENAKLLTGQDKFYEDLMYFDKDQMPDDLYEALGRVISDDNFNPENFQIASVATGSLCEWIRAVYTYNHCMRQLQPKLLLLEKCEARISATEVKIIQSSVMQEELTVAVAQSSESFQKSLKKEEEIVDELEELKKMKAEAEHFQEEMEAHARDWKASLEVLEDRSHTVPGDALLLAACTCYLGPFPSQRREELLEKWQRLCKGWDTSLHPDDLNRELEKCLASASSLPPPNAPIPLREDFNIVDLLNTVHENRNWHRTEQSCYSTAQNLALLLQTCVAYCPRRWPLLVDPDRQGEAWIRRIFKGVKIQMRPTRDKSMDEDTQTPGMEATDSNVSAAVDKKASDLCVIDDTDSDTDEELQETSSKDTQIPEKEAADADFTATESDVTATGSDFTATGSDFTATGSDFTAPGSDFAATDCENFPDLCIIHAMDPDIDEKLQAASAEGAAILVTSVDRGPNSSVLKSIVCKENLFRSRSSKSPAQTGRCFQLYLCTSLPLDDIGNALDSAFLKNLGVFDMTTNLSDLEGELLDKILLSEKPELQRKRGGMEIRIRQLEDELSEVEESLLGEVVKVDKPLLEIKDFLLIVHNCQRKMSLIRSDLQGLESLQLQQAECLQEYRKVAQHGAALYGVLQDVSRLHPIYNFPLVNFLQAVRNCLLTNKRQEAMKRENLKARVIDLINSFTSCVLSYGQPCLSESHTKIFHLLVAAAQLRLGGQMTNLEWHIFLHGLKSSSVDHNLPESVAVQPQWVTANVWTECACLELLPAFKNLRLSLENQGSQWQEYFNLSTSVIGHVPCASFAHLTLIQKAILWRVLQPGKLLNVMSDLSTCMLGQSPEDHGSEIDSIFPSSSASVPLVILMPGSGSAGLSTHPLYWIEQMAAAHGQEGFRTVISFGAPDSEDELLATLIAARKDGHWLVLNNCHLLDHWDPDVIQILTELMESSDGEEVLPEGLDSRHTLVAAKDSGNKVHPDFRLWFITERDAAESLPAIVKRWSIKFFCETPMELKSTLKRSLGQACSRLTPQTVPQQLLVLVVLHAVLLHRQRYDGIAEAAVYHWTQEDLFAALRIQERLLKVCNDLEEAMVVLAGYVIYGGHIVDPGDEEAVFSVVRQSLESRFQLLPMRGIHSLIFALASRSLSGFQVSESWIRETQTRIEQLPYSADAVTFGLCEGVAEAMNKIRCREVLADLLMTQCVWLPSPLKEPQIGSMMDVLGECVTLLTEMALGVKSTREGTNRTEEKPLLRFLLGELNLFSEMISKLSLDLGVFQEQLLGDPCPCNICKDIAYALVRGTLPKRWAIYTIPRTKKPVLQWLQHLKHCQKLLIGYIESFRDGATEYYVYNLSAFRHPKKLLVAVMQEQAQSERHDMDQYMIEVQVTQRSSRMRTTMLHGIYLTGLELRNALWDTRLAVIQETLSSKPCSLPDVMVHAVRQSEQACATGSVFPRYSCPLYLGTTDEEVVQLREQTVMFLPLASKIDPCVCSQRHVHAVSVLS